MAEEAEKEYNENKQKEMETQNNTNTEIKDISKTEYTQNRKDLKDLKNLLDFYKDELEQIHVNDKKNRAKKEEQINNVEQTINKKEAENKKYEETKKQVNKGDKESKEKPAKEKKIGKTYSIAYDNDTIEKLKSLGKTWQDKRIYFKDLNNSYYDLVSEKWVTDSPETTKKAMEMASESLEDRENRIANAKKEAEEEKKREYEAKEAKEKPLSFFDFMEITNDTAFDNMSRDEVWEIYGDLYKKYKKEHYQRIKDNTNSKDYLNSVINDK